MKNFKWTGAVLAGLAMTAVLLKLQAQTVANPNEDAATVPAEPLVMNSADMATVPTLSTAELAAFLSALAATPQIAYTNIGDQAFTFYSLQNPGWPPLPYDSSHASAWPMQGFMLLNDVYFDYTAAAQANSAKLRSGSGMMAMSADDLTPPGDDGGGTNTYTPNNLPAPDYGTNLWIAQVALANGSLTAIASNTLPGVWYEVQTNADLTTTNWGAFAAYSGFYGASDTNWTPLNAILVDPGTTNLFFRLLSFASSDGSSLPDWWEQAYGVTDPYGDPDGDGWNNLQEYQNGTNPNQFNPPPTPQGLTVSLHQASQTAGINWLPSPGQVTGYSIEKTDILTNPDTVQTNNVLSGVTSFTDDISGNSLDPWYGNIYEVSYRIRANYANGSSSPWSASMPLQPVNVSGVIIFGVGGTATLTVAGLPANAVTVRLYFGDGSDGAIANHDTSFNYSKDVPVTSLVNGSYQMPAAWQPPATDAYGPANYTVFLKAVDASGNEGGATIADSPDGNWNQPFYDARAQLKQNLIFQLRAAPVDAPLTFAIPATNNYDFGSFGASVGDYDYPASYAYAGLYQFANSIGDYYESFDALLPFKENNLFRNFVFSSADADTNGILTTGIFAGYKDGYFEYHAFVNLCRPLTYQFQDGQTNGPALLPADQTRWLFYDPPMDYDDVRESGLVNIDGNTVSLTNNYRNWFGLPYVSTLVARPSDPPGTLLTSLIEAGQTAVFPTNEDPSYFNYYPETAQPQFQAMEYDFFNTAWIWNETLQEVVPPPPRPGDSAFATTNQSQILFATPGNSIQIAGYAKLAVTNGYAGVYAYLGQYFDKAYQVADNGSVTTNQTGILSPYGDFFATEPGDAALVTLPDLDTGERGTGIVHCVSLVLDKNHDGIMDGSFSGQDATTASSPMEFWDNDNYDRWDDDGVFDTLEQDDVQPGSDEGGQLNADPDTPDCNYHNLNGDRVIPGTRDLEDFARLRICGFNDALITNLPYGSTVTLSWGDIGNPNTSNPTIDIFRLADSSGGMGYLTNEATATEEVNDSASLYLGRVGPGQGITLPAYMFDSEHYPNSTFIWCGVSNGTGGLTLTITDGNSNALVQTTAYIQIQDIKQMYERWTVGDQPSRAPMTNAILATDNLPVGMPAFQYTPPQDTNTPYILFVHGWNMPTWLKARYAETEYKRIYWQGYQGRFGALDWPTYTGFTTYDPSEFNAWQSAQGLLNLLTQLNAEYPGQVYLTAHSMGNVVAGEALRLAGNNQVVNTYIAMQGAIPAQCYDQAATARSLGSDDSGTPNRYANYYSSSAPCYFNGIGGAGAFVNFFNTNDFALSAWTIDQNLKPDVLRGYGFDGTNFYSGYIPPYELLLFPVDTYEVFSFCDEARCYALGAQPDVRGVFSTTNQVNLPSVWPPDSNEYNAHIWHSAEFRSDSAQRWQFWNTILIKFSLKEE